MTAPPPAVLLPAAPPATAAAHSPGEACLNCGAPLVGPFCAACGQRNGALRQPLRAFAVESFSEYWGLDGRLWRSARDLLFRPGKLTVDYVDGRRTAALRPFRLYLTATLLFFVTLGLDRSDEEPAPASDAPVVVPAGPIYASDSLLGAADAARDLDLWVAALNEQRQALAIASRVLGVDSTTGARVAHTGDSLRTAGARFARVRDSLRALPDTIHVRAGRVGLAGRSGRVRGKAGDDMVPQTAAAGIVRSLPDWLKGDLARDVERARTPAAQDAAQDAATEALVGQIPTAMFAVLPVFAVLLKLLYLGGGGIELRGRRRPVPPAGAPAGASLGRRAWAELRLRAWRAGQAVEKAQVRRRIRAARRPWRQALRRLRARLPARVRVGRIGWLRRAATARRTRFYAEHVVFTLHVHAFAFVVFWALLLVGNSRWAPWGGWLVAAIPVYFLLAQRRVYAQSWGKTLVKSALLGTAYSVVLTLGVLVAAALAARLG